LQIRTSRNGFLNYTMYFSPIGRVGIGNSDPRAHLDIGDGVGNASLMLRRGNSNHARMISSSGPPSGGDPNTALLLNSYDLNTNSWIISAWIAWDGTYVNTSDRRLKENISSLQKVLPSVLQLNPVTYNFTHIKNETKKNMGFIAQEVESLFPELISMVSDNNNQELKGINYSGFGVIAIKAIQEQQKIIEDLQKQINELRNAIKKTTPLLQ
jgi:hypothetical protein